jgi:hypothetical protein
MTSINLLTVCTEDYPMRYAETLISRFGQVSRIKFTPYCITDRPDEITGLAQPIKPLLPVTGWWHKIDLFSDSMPDGWNLYLDLDIVILRNFDKEILSAIKLKKDMACVSDAISWLGQRFSSSMMIFKTGSQNHIFRKYQSEYAQIGNAEGGDQVYAGPMIRNPYFLDEQFPNLKKNLKFQLAHREGNELKIPLSISKDIKLIDCAGKPKPHELDQVPYIKANWHDAIK